LRIRRLTQSDAPFLLQLLNEPSFIQNIGDRGVRTLEDAAKYMETGPLASYAQFGFGLYLVELASSAAPIGICGILQRSEMPCPDLGFAFLPAYWSQGFAFEAAAAVRDYARDVLRIPELLAIVNPSNASSMRLLDRLGFESRGPIRRHADAAELVLYGCRLV
jgi:RimJ/RimL family protein N-acetyltransferase